MSSLLNEFIAEELDVKVVKGAPIPLSLTPRSDATDAFSLSHLAEPLLEATAERGALLLHRLSRVGPKSMEEFALACWSFSGRYETREHPIIPGSDAVWRPIAYAKNQRLLWHHEDSFKAVWPRFIMFACVEPARLGGELCLVDGRMLHELASEKSRSSVSDGILYRRFCDGHAGRSWQDLFATESRENAIELAAERGETLSFRGDCAVLEAVRPAFLDTPHGKVWFNQLLHWHPEALPPSIREYVLQGLIPKHRDCLSPCGTPIDSTVVREVNKLCEEIERPISLGRNELLIVDNKVFAHGRNSFQGDRNILVLVAGESRFADSSASK